MELFLNSIDNVLYGIEVIIAFGLLVTAHEFGHFLLAKASGMRVDEFAIGFGKAIFSFRRGETLYSLRMIPLGGYNGIYGMEFDEDSIDEQELSQEDRKRAFNLQPIYKRAAVVLAGSLMNLFLAVVLIFVLRSVWGVEMAQVFTVNPNGPAHKAGMRAGDVFWTIQDERVGGMNIQLLVQQASASHGGVKIEVERDGQLVPMTINPVGLSPLDLKYCDLGFAYFKDGLVERVAENSAAEKLGLISGDYIGVKDGKPGERFVKVDGEYYLAMDINRYSRRFTLALPREELHRTVSINYSGLGFGYDSSWRVLSVDEYSVLMPTSSQANLRGLKPGDIILEVDGRPVDEFVFGEDDPFAEAASRAIEVVFRRGDEVISRKFSPGGERRHLGITLQTRAANIVSEIDAKGVAFKAGLRKEDEIIAVGREQTSDGIDVLKKLAFVYSGPRSDGLNRILHDPEHLSDIPRELWEVEGLEAILPGALGKGTGDASDDSAGSTPTYRPYLSHIEPYLTLTARREGELHDIAIDMKSADKEVGVMSYLGFTFAPDFRRVGFLEAWRSGFVEMGYWIRFVFYSLKLIATRQASIRELSGPVGIITITYLVAESGLQSLLNLLVILTVSLAIFNLLPVPALDGGRMIFLLLEMVARRPVVSVKVENVIHIAGFLLLLLFVLYITYFDFLRVFKGWFI